LAVVALGAVASSARAEHDNAVKLITSPANFAARPQDVRFLRRSIGVTWTGPGHVGSGRLRDRQFPRVRPAKPTICERAGKEANAVVFISTAPVDLIFEFEDKIVWPAKISLRAGAAHAPGMDISAK
jgi:hypothetical protein